MLGAGGVLEYALGEVEAGGGAAEVENGGVVSTRRGDGGGVGAEPDSRALVGLPYFGDPFSPLPHPNPSVGFVLCVLPFSFGNFCA